MQHHPPSVARAHAQWQQGCQRASRNDWPGAEANFSAAVRLQPREPIYWLNLARAQLRRGDLAGAAEAAQRALKLRPADETACALAAHCLIELQRPADVVALLQAYPAEGKRDAGFHLVLGQALEALHRPQEAIAAYMDALALKVDLALAHARLGFCFNRLEMREEAAQCFRTAHVLGVGEQNLCILGQLAYREREVCRWVDAASDTAAIRAGVEALADTADTPVTVFTMLSMEDDPALHRRAARSASRYLARGLEPLPPVTLPAPAGRRLRIGYVSSDFFHHATSILIAGMLESHDRERFEVTLYSHSLDDASAMRTRVLGAAEHVVDIAALDVRQAARRIRDDAIDILVDLKGFTKESRVEMFALRPAPLQVSFLGYPGTIGAEWMDYVIGDPQVTPLGHAADFSEKIAQMPVCYQPNDSRRPLPAAASRADAGLPQDAVVLCGFNQPYKISPAVFDSWCRILHEVPEAVLWLLEWNPQVRKNLEPEAIARGIDPARIVWAPLVKYEPHITRLSQADLFLDTWPYNAHTTASDALWAGVPVVTLRGRSFASRVAASLDHALGLDELVFDSVAAFEAGTVALARDPGRRAALRQRLEGRFAAPVFDSARFARDLEHLYHRMAERCAAGLPPDHLPADAAGHAPAGQGAL
jgi:predicted O-linked N-acetylglucosamine transferase (SPINDLY family)